MTDINQNVINDWVQKVTKHNKYIDEAYGVCLKIPNPYLVPVFRKLFEIRCSKDTRFSKEAQGKALRKLEHLFSEYKKDSLNDDFRRKGIRIVFWVAEINHVIKLWEDRINSSADFSWQFKYLLGVWVYWYFSTQLDSSTRGIGKTDMSSHFPREEAERLMRLAGEKMAVSKNSESLEDTRIQKLCLELESKDEESWRPALAELERILLSKYSNTSPDRTTQDTLDKIKIILGEGNDAFAKHIEGLYINDDHDPRY